VKIFFGYANKEFLTTELHKPVRALVISLGDFKLGGQSFEPNQGAIVPTSITLMMKSYFYMTNYGKYVCTKRFVNTRLILPRQSPIPSCIHM
jgi:hypothetical protein